MKSIALALFAVCVFANLYCGQTQSSLLANWQQVMLPLIANQTILDISLPGTHDTMTYDLSTVVSDGGDDGSEDLSYILHLASELGLTPGAWIRNQSQTQIFTITQQLNNGVRFIDFRIMFTSDDWYCLHFMQTIHTAIMYLTEVKAWLLQHPGEIVVFWFSKHGNTCDKGNDQYPGVPISVKQAFWARVESLFSGMLLDTRVSAINTTTIGELVKRNQRVIIFASDYVEFTKSSPLAIDGCLVDNQLCASVDDEPQNLQCDISLFTNSKELKRKDKQQGRFFLLSMASSGSSKGLEYAFFLEYLDIDRNQITQDCASLFNIPGMTDWCPPHLLDISQLTNYYNQIPLEMSIRNMWGFPNAIYLDAVDVDGTIRTGAEIEGDTSRYAYAATLLLYNALSACGSNVGGVCGQVINELKAIRAQYPIKRWDQIEVGRSSTWPVKYP